MPSASVTVAIVAVVLATGGTSYAIKANTNAARVDGLRAVRSTATTKRAAGRLVATVRKGPLRGQFDPRFLPTVDHAHRADSAAAADLADRANAANSATSASHADTANTASSANTANTANTAGSAGTAETATTAGDARTLGGKNAAQLTDGCPSGTLDGGALCFETGIRAAATPLTAFKTCAQAGGFVPQASELLGASMAGKITLTAEEWSGNVVGTGATPYLTVNSFGPASLFGPANTEPFRCAFTPREQ